MQDRTTAELVVLAERHTEAIAALVDQVRALTAVNVALFEELGDIINRDHIRRTALTVFGSEGPDSGVAKAIEVLTGEGPQVDPDRHN